MIKEFTISTRSRAELTDITSKVENLVRESRIKSGVCEIFVPHTTAGITINENADPSVRKDILAALERLVPFDGDYEHREGNAAAHIKSTILGADLKLFVEDGILRLGTWQGIFFCEFDGPRQRRVLVKIIEDAK